MNDPASAEVAEGTDSRRPETERPLWARALRHPAVRRATVVGAILVVLELLMFWGYFTGDVSPAPDDFFGSYNNEPMAWWRDLSRWDIPEWVPYVWGGYPAAVSVQSGAWYIPIGLWSIVTPYSVHAAATLQALHVAFGALGAYALTRRWNLHHTASIFALVAYFFATGFFTNALHPDIVRGFAWAPWVFLCLSPAFPWRRWWGIPMAAIVLWQTVVASYPGIVPALAYCGIAWVIAAQLGGRHRFGDYLGPLSLAAVAAVLLTGPKYLSAVLLRGGGSPTGFDGSEFTNSMWGTLFFPYDLPWLPNDLSMRSFFVVAPCLVLIAVSWRRRHPHIKTVVTLGLCAVALGLPRLPWYDLLAGLPGLSMSRFRMSDFRVPLVVAAVLLASLALSAEITGAARRRIPTLLGKGEVATWSALTAVPVVALISAVRWDYPIERWALPWTLVVGSAVVVGLVCRPTTDRAAADRGSGAMFAGVAIVALAAVSGVTWAYSVTAPWRSPRADVEVAAWGTTSDDLVDDFRDPVGLTQRPARTPLDDAKGPPMDVVWNTAYYTGTDAVGGYINLRGSPSFDAQLATVLNEETYFESRVLLAAPGLGIAVPDARSLPAVDDVAPCAIDGDCGAGLSVYPDGYRPGHLRYEIEATRDTLVLFNEAFYPGWEATLCRDTAGSCLTPEPTQSSAGLILLQVPRGTWEVSLDYETPGMRVAYAGFGLGLVVLAASALVVGRKQRRGANRPDPSADIDSAPAAPERDL